MNIKKIIKIIENLAPIEYAEKFDNVGLIIGSYEAVINKILLTIDITSEVMKEAIHLKSNLIISFHPLLFKKNINSIIREKHQDNIIIEAIKNNINIYSCHTNLDNIFHGSNHLLANLLDLTSTRVLIPKYGTMGKLTTYIPLTHVNKLRNALFNSGCGVYNNYYNCSFNFNGIGTFSCKSLSQPFLGKKNKINFEKEVCLNITFPYFKYNLVKKILFDIHPYEEVVYEVYKLNDNENLHVGNGLLCECNININDINFIKLIKNKLKLSFIKHSKLLNIQVKKVAIIVGSGGFGIKYAKKLNVDVFISSDIKYHDFFLGNNSMVIIDIGHYESEIFIKKFLYKYLNKKIPNFTVIDSNINTNPVYYK